MLSNKIDSYINKFLKFIVPSIFLLHFLVDANYYFPFITTRNFLFRIIITIVLALYLYLYFRNKSEYGFAKNKLLIAYIGLALVLTVSSLLGGDFLYSFWSNYERMEGLLGLYYLIALFIVILGLYKRKKAWLDLLRVSVWSALIMGIMALSQHWHINLFIESSGGERVTGTLGNATYLAVYALFNLFFALYLLFKDKNKRPKLELWLFYVLDILLIIVEIFGSGKGPLSGIFSDLRIFLLFVAPQIFINLQYHFYNSNKAIKYSKPAYFSLIILLNFIALFNTQTRGVLVGILGAAIVVTIFLLFSKYVKKKFKYFILGALALIILLTSSVFTFKDSTFVQSNNTLRRVADISVSDATAETRLLTWKLSLKAFKEKPMLGWGEEKFYVVFNKYFPNQIFKGAGSRVWFDRPHNVFFQQLVHGGILGLLIYLSIFWFALCNLWRHYKNTHDPITISILGGLMIAYLIQNFFVFDSLNSYILMIIFLAISIFLAGEVEEKSFLFRKLTSLKNKITSLTVRKDTKEFNKRLAISSALLVLILGFSINIPQLMTNRNFINQYQDLRKNIGQGQYQKADLDELLETINSQYFGKFELRQVYSEFAATLVQTSLLTQIEKQYFIDTAEEMMLDSIAEQSDNVRHHSFLLNMYMQSSILNPIYLQKGIDLTENKAIPLSPSRIQLYYSLGQLYINSGQNEKAIDNFIKGQELAPKVFDSYYNLFITYLNLNDLDMAKLTILEMFENVDEISLESYVHISQAYEHFGFTAEAEDIKNKAFEKFKQ
ncbi:MAG: hypothetical protein HOE19_00130 [Candidatus Komeilibacteria bacterium]|jgi:O-antigen ligase|nr:hypothetical protein [Candidatus Komeilibacteria bacterium]MBT4448015.1 hypothetical protein [Candidatus Komeilibacteria bacterium]